MCDGCAGAGITQDSVSTNMYKVQLHLVSENTDAVAAFEIC